MSKHLEKEVRGFVGWCRAFLGRVEGTNGVTMHWEWEEQLCSLEAALPPKPTEPARKPPCDLCVPDREGICVNCGWSR